MWSNSGQGSRRIGHSLGKAWLNVVDFFARPIYPPSCLAGEMDESKDAEIERTYSFSSRLPKFSARGGYWSIKSG